MKIRCTKKEFAQLIRGCENGGQGRNYSDCVMADVCGEELIEDAVEFEIEEEN